jgi:hypothetical protein
MLKIDFGNLIFLNNSNGETGKNLFKECEMNDVVSIDFNRSV